MKLFFTMILVCATASIAAAAQKKNYETGKIIEVQKKAETRVLYYLVNTPVTADDPYYEVSIQVKDTVYVADFTPRHSADAPDWHAGDSLQVSVEKRHLKVKSPEGDDLDLDIVKHSPAS
jgi:hypothetical protein